MESQESAAPGAGRDEADSEEGRKKRAKLVGQEASDVVSQRVEGLSVSGNNNNVSIGSLFVVGVQVLPSEGGVLSDEAVDKLRDQCEAMCAALERYDVTEPSDAAVNAASGAQKAWTRALSMLPPSRAGEAWVGRARLAVTEKAEKEARELSAAQLRLKLLAHHKEARTESLGVVEHIDNMFSGCEFVSLQIKQQLQHREIDLGDIFVDGLTRVVISGPSGSGKSTLLMRAARDWSHGVLWRGLFDCVVVLDLGQLADCVSLCDALASTLVLDSREDAQKFCQWSKGKKVLWIIDGWNEQLSLEKKKSVFSQIRMGGPVDEARVEWVLFGVREESEGRFANVKHVKLRGLTEKGVVEYVKRYPFENADSEMVVQHKLEDVSCRELCRLPLMLRVLCMTAQESDREPVTKTFLCRAVSRNSVSLATASDGREKGRHLMREMRRLAFDWLPNRRDTITDKMLDDGEYLDCVNNCTLLRCVSRITGGKRYVWLHNIIAEFLAAEFVCMDLPESAVSTTLVEMRNLPFISSQFFAFVCGVGGDAASSCREQWIPREDFVETPFVSRLVWRERH